MTNKNEKFQRLIEGTTEMLNDNLIQSIASANMLKDILILFSDDENKLLRTIGRQVYNKSIQETASKLLELCFLDENIENLN